MAKKKTEKTMACSPVHGGCCAMSWKILLVVVALLFLATDMGWITWWKLNWWTVGFILIALRKLFVNN